MMMLGLALALLPVVCVVYAYAVYPALLAALGRRATRSAAADPPEWPELTILVPVYNEATSIVQTLEALLALDYPADRRHLLVVSDASTDGTDALVATLAPRGVTLVRAPVRAGKTAAENLAVPHCRGELVVSVDATVRLPVDALRALVRAFGDPSVGVASGRDVSVGAGASEQSGGERGYVGFEMWLRGLETEVGSIVGASGCFFATRRQLLDPTFPARLSKDFATPLHARRAGYRSVSVDAAVCYVKRAPALRAEYRRKVRTMARGLATLWHERDLLDPFRYGAFAWMLWSHKLVRWLVFLTLPLGLAGLAILAPRVPAAAALLAAAVVGALLGVLAINWPGRGAPPRPLAILGFLTASHAAGFAAWMTALRGAAIPVWEPTRR